MLKNKLNVFKCLFVQLPPAMMTKFQFYSLKYLRSISVLSRFLQDFHDPFPSKSSMKLINNYNTKFWVNVELDLGNLWVIFTHQFARVLLMFFYRPVVRNFLSQT